MKLPNPQKLTVPFHGRTGPLQGLYSCLWSVLLSESEWINFLPVTMSLSEFFLPWDIKNLSSIRSWNQVLWVLAGFESQPHGFKSQSKVNGFRYRRHSFNPWVRKIPWRRKWQPTPVFLGGKSHGQKRLVGYSPRSCKRIGCNLETSTKWILHFISNAVLNIRHRGTNKLDKNFSLQGNHILVRKRIDNVD